jgi:hypothetical protein
MAEPDMEPFLIVLAFALFLVHRHSRAKWLSRVWRLVMEGQMSINRGALLLALMLWSTSVFVFLIARAILLGDPNQGVFFTVAWGLLLMPATLMMRAILAWQIAHPSKVNWWSPERRGRFGL